jgi:hypothetical protein
VRRASAACNGPDQARLAFFIESLSDTGPASVPTDTGTGNNLLRWSEHGGETLGLDRTRQAHTGSASRKASERCIVGGVEVGRAELPRA